MIQHLTVTIPTPRKIPKTYGSFGTYANVNCLYVRLSLHEQNIVDEAAETCGVTRAGFMRWCAVLCANQILKQEKNKHTVVEQVYGLSS